MKKQRILNIALILTSMVTTTAAILIYFSAVSGKARIDEESHHLFLSSEKYKSFILKENKGLSPQELLKKYNVQRKLTAFEVKEGLVELDLLYFRFKEGKLIGVE